jgi:hypothetical protein
MKVRPVPAPRCPGVVKWSRINLSQAKARNFALATGATSKHLILYTEAEIR